MSMKKHLSRAHCGFESGETVVEGAKNGDHVLGDILALLQRLSDKCGSPAQNFHRLWNSHWRWNFLRNSLPMRLVRERICNNGGAWSRRRRFRNRIQAASIAFCAIFSYPVEMQRRKMKVVAKSYSLSVYGPRLYTDGPYWRSTVRKTKPRKFV